ncbi:hypothetical protein MMC07_005764 [Pseudocyphellaria aurata]|nr:hypothetical protein [Pseudocyphellaria aurata]
MADTKGIVFITGASGFIASQIVSDLIEETFSVVASVRSEAKAQEILDTHPDWKGKVSFVYVPDIAAERAFDHVFKDAKTPFDFIIHTASPVNFSVDDFQKDLIDPAVRGTTDLLNCAHQLGGSKIKRFVLLGSAVAVLDSFNDKGSAGPDYTEEDWNPVTAASAIESNSVVLGYNASKKLAEQAAWQFITNNKPSFDLTVINPDIVLGPMLQPVRSAKNVNATNGFAIYDFLNGTYKDVESIQFPFYHFVHVRDVSRAHVLSLTTPAAAGQRILVVAGLITPQLVINIIRKNFPELHDRIIEGNPDRIVPEGVDPRGWVTKKSFDIFGQGWGYRGLEETVLDTVNCLLAFEKGWETK